MEVLLVFIGLAIIGSFLDNSTNDKGKDKAKSSSTIPTTQTKYEHIAQPINNIKKETINVDEKIVVNNYYTQNNITIQQNNYSNSDSSKHTDHTERVWKRMGYRVKYGETYSYKHYGNEIYTPNQVEKIGSNYHVHTSENGLARKLLSDTGSKRMAKDILVDQYGYTQNNAKKLVGYRGY